jgi:nucleoside-diphosphate-sugar epimerase
MQVLVMGGTRLMGEAAVRHLLSAGHAVTVFNRGTREVAWADEVAWVIGDRDTDEGIRQLSGRAFDYVVDFSAYRPAQSASLLGVIGSEVPVVYCSSGSVYAPQAVLPWPETTPYGPSALWGAYARAKLDCELLLRDEAGRGRPIIVFRLPYVLGPRNYAQREEFVLNRLLDAAPIAIPGDGEAPQQFITADQVGRSVARMVASPIPPGFTDVNLADPDGVATLLDFVAACSTVSGTESRLVHVAPRASGTGAGDVFDALDCVFPFPNAPYVLDLAKADSLGWLPPSRPLRDAIATAFEVLKTEPERRAWTRTPAEATALGLEQ